MRFVLVFLFSIIFIAVANAIFCYDCDSLHDPRCNQYFSPEGVKQEDCDEAEMPEYLKKYERRIKATGCITKIHEGVEGFRYFIRRSCYFGELDKTDEACNAEDEYLPFADLLSCEVCDEDLCNKNAGKILVLSNIILVIGFLCSFGFYRIRLACQ